MDWIKMRTDLYEDPAILRIAEKLRERPEVVVGYCHKFWSWVSRQCHDGSVTHVTLESVENVLSMPNFLHLMCDVGWLEYVESTSGRAILIPKFERHLSQGAKARALASERRRHARVTFLSRSQRDKIVTREEKRRRSSNEDLREEKRERKEKKDAAVPLSPSGDVSFNPSLVGLPFPSEHFQAAWVQWCQHRAELRRPLTPRTTESCLSELAGWGEARAVAAINHTIARGWVGIREPDAKSGNGKGQPFDKAKILKVLEGAEVRK